MGRADAAPAVACAMVDMGGGEPGSVRIAKGKTPVLF